MKVLFVCTGNTCRSIMAEGITKSILYNLEDKPDIEIASAGIAAYPDSPGSRYAIEVMKENNIDISNHKARMLTLELIESTNLILTMTAAHQRAILNYFPATEEKVYVLKEFAGGLNGLEKNKDINDPFGGDIKVYRDCATELKDVIEKAIEQIIKNL